MTPTQRDEEFTAFTRDHRTDLVRMARLLTAGDHAGAEDLVQATLTRLYLAWSRVRRADNRLGYARTSLTHGFVDESRRAHRRREAIQPDPTLGRAEPTSDGPDLDQRSAVLASLRQLPPRQRAVVVLRHWLDLDTAETARVLGCSTGTVKSQNARALAHLRGALAALDLPTPQETP